jgi:hypothetical protein
MIASQSLGLAQQIERAQQANEAKLLAEVDPPRFNLDTELLLHLRHFKAFCQQHGVKDCPARPATVAAFVRGAAAGVQPERILEGLQAIELLHDNAGLANPIASAAVRCELGRIFQIEAPRSWKKSDGLLFNGLPIEVRAVIARRARQDELTLRRLQNEVANLRKKGITNGKEELR